MKSQKHIVIEKDLIKRIEEANIYPGWAKLDFTTKLKLLAELALSQSKKKDTSKQISLQQIRKAS